MINIQSLLKDFKHKNPSTKVLYKRQEIIKMFVDTINRGRLSSGYRELSPGYVASKMYNAGLKDDFDLYWFYGYCKDSKNFCATWWWSLDPKNSKT